MSRRHGKRERQEKRETLAGIFAAHSAHIAEASRLSRITEATPLRSSAERVSLKGATHTGFYEAKAKLRPIDKRFLKR